MGENQKPPRFFVPGVEEADQEAAYADLAQFAGRPPTPLAERVFSITYKHDGELWTSTVAEASRGTQTRTTGRGSGRREAVTRLSDPAITLAIFPGNPYVIVTDHNLRKRRATSWANPFLMGPGSISASVLFAK